MATKKEKTTEAKSDTWCYTENKKTVASHGSAGAVWCLGFIGAAVYYIQTANDFWGGFVGVLKAFVWPAFLVYSAMKSLGM